MPQDRHGRRHEQGSTAGSTAPSRQPSHVTVCAVASHHAMVPAGSAAHHAYIGSAELRRPRHHIDKIHTRGIDLYLRACSAPTGRSHARLSCESPAGRASCGRMPCNGPTRCRGLRRPRPACAHGMGRGRGRLCPQADSHSSQVAGAPARDAVAQIIRSVDFLYVCHNDAILRRVIWVSEGPLRPAEARL